MCRVIVMGACPHDDHAQSSNWGIFNQHIWGDYNQHSQLALSLPDNIAIGAPLAPSWQTSSLFPASFLRTGDASRPVGSAYDPARSSGSRMTDWTALVPQSAGLFIASGHGEARR
ncbi:hypothetical protein HKD31_15805 [Gluconobacter sp. R71646]|uniref:Uncharacterized protein n=1 Tax=Gluconobacter potus TaxID=2724927 RepID=A0ABR9YQT7_9PROT|nr:hypothetical protein [Gluconobacter sp. R71656]MBF0869196.1 hypothetical protein [Gluconobacter sp. R75628]MBF0875189.1 hypothetical protein [Gluconobacter sp. R75629]MBF0884162.1 hypothetical protein [Gluconobacter potus]SAY46718.1 hypothetical protein KRIGEM_03517 [Komagataeibacter rhaeticus]